MEKRFDRLREPERMVIWRKKPREAGELKMVRNAGMFCLAVLGLLWAATRAAAVDVTLMKKTYDPTTDYTYMRVRAPNIGTNRQVIIHCQPNGSPPNMFVTMSLLKDFGSYSDYVAYFKNRYANCKVGYVHNGPGASPLWETNACGEECWYYASAPTYETAQHACAPAAALPPGLDLSPYYFWTAPIPAAQTCRQYAVGETRTWVYEDPLASAMRVTLGSVQLNHRTNFSLSSRIEILDGDGDVVQMVTANKTGTFTSCSVPGNKLQVRYVGGAEGGGGSVFANHNGRASDSFNLVSYAAKRFFYYQNSAAAPTTAYTVAYPPAPGPVTGIASYSDYALPIMVKRPFDWNTEDSAKIRVDFILDGDFLGSAAPFSFFDSSNAYFLVWLPLGEWYASHGPSCANLQIRETRASGWTVQTLALPLRFSDPRSVVQDTLDLTAAVGEHFGKTNQFTIENSARVFEAQANWTVKPGSPNADVDMELRNAAGQIIATSAHHPAGGGSQEAISRYLSPGTYSLAVRSASGSCAGFNYTAQYRLRY